MRTLCLRLLVFAAVSLPAVPGFAGQGPAKTKAGEEVIVTHAGSGVELRGRLVELSSTSLAILVDGQRREIPIDDVLRIDSRKDSLKNGTLIGLGIFAGLAVLTCPEIDSAGWCAYGIALNAGMGAAIGAGIDALHKGRSPIYVKAARGGSALQMRFRF
jgi:hypothetical protein